jgi:asparagine synthase (glutamine-hydrolysing)
MASHPTTIRLVLTRRTQTAAAMTPVDRCGVIAARVNGPFTSPKARSSKRIAGASATAEVEWPETFSILGRDGFVADSDCCFLDAAGVDVFEPSRIGDIQGAFAIAWRNDTGSLSIARDPVGERTLYYWKNRNQVLFASTIRALLGTGLVPRRLNTRGLATYLSCAYLPGRDTLVDGVYELLPGEIVEFEGEHERHIVFWNPPETNAEGDEEELRMLLRGELEGAVRRRLPVTGAVAATLSGGIDSSLVVALLCRLHSSEIQTWSVSFGADYPNELEFSSLVAEHCGTNHRILEIGPSAILRYLDESIGCLNDPIGDPLTVPNSLLFREASGECNVVFNGEGGDPTFGGPKNLPMVLAEVFGDGYNGADDPQARARSYLRAHLKCYDELDEILIPEIAENHCLEESILPHLHDKEGSFLSSLTALNIRFKGGHHILPKVDYASEPFGVLPRSPLFDRRVVEFALRLRPSLKLKGSVEKYLLKESVRDLLPGKIVDRPKSGMLVPVEGWFRGPLQREARARILDGLGSTGLFRHDYLERLVAGKLRGLRPRHGVKTWLFLTLESWLRTHRIKI